MLKEDLKRIKIGDEEYPVHCSILVLEEIQNEFGTVEEFEKKLLGQKEKKQIGIPDPHAIAFGLIAMVNEGVAIFNTKTNMDKIKPVTKDILREAEINIPEMSAKIHDVFMECFERKKEETK